MLEIRPEQFHRLELVVDIHLGQREIHPHHHTRPSLLLYQLTNKNGGENGFLPISREEVKILLYIHEFIGLLRDEIAAEIVNERNFLISIVPLMRGYCQIVADNESKNKLTKLMHGYEAEPVNVS